MAEEFSKLLTNLPTLAPNSQLIRYYKVGGGEFVTSNSTDYELISLDLLIYLDSIPVNIANNTSPILSVIIGQKNRVVKALINPRWVKTLSQTNRPSLFNKTEVEKSIRQGRIIEINPGPEILIQASDLVEIEITSAELEYQYSDSKQLLIPSYNLSAKILTKKNVFSTAKIIVPAVTLPYTLTGIMIWVSPGSPSTPNTPGARLSVIPKVTLSAFTLFK